MIISIFGPIFSENFLGWPQVGSKLLQFAEGFLNPAAPDFGVLSGFRGIGLRSLPLDRVLVTFIERLIGGIFPPGRNQTY